MKRLDTNAVFQEFKIKKRNKSCSSLHNREIFFFKMLPSKATITQFSSKAAIYFLCDLSYLYKNALPSK